MNADAVDGKFATLDLGAKALPYFKVNASSTATENFVILNYCSSASECYALEVKIREETIDDHRLVWSEGTGRSSRLAMASASNGFSCYLSMICDVIPDVTVIGG